MRKPQENYQEEYHDMTLQLLFVDDPQWLCVGFEKYVLTVNISLVVKRRLI